MSLRGRCSFARSNLILTGGCFVGKERLLATTLLHISNKAITDPRLGEDKLRALGVNLKFLAKLAHVDTQVFGVIGIGRIPDICEDALMGEHAPVIGCKIRE